MSVHELGAIASMERLGIGAAQSQRSQLDQVNVNALSMRLWPASIRRNDAGAVEVGGLDVRDLAEAHGTPAYVLDESDFRSRATAFKKAFNDAFADLCSGADVYYACKAFLCTEVARWLSSDGLRMDACSGGELVVLLRAGVKPADVILHGNNKSDSELREAVKQKIGRIVIDSLSEIDRVAAIAADMKSRADVLLRVTVGVQAHTHEYIATAHDDQKFGVSLASGAAAAAVRRILSRPELSLRGLHSHVGSQVFDIDELKVAVRRLLGLHAAVRQEYGAVLPEMNLGGGFGVAYVADDDPLAPKTLADALADVVRAETRELRVPVPRIAIEPGRAVAGPSTFTLYRVGTVKQVTAVDGLPRMYVAVDGGMSDNIRTALYDANYTCVMASRMSDAPPARVRVVGKHCENGDVIVRDVLLPSDVAPGDLLAVPGTGAYCRSMASQYNFMPRPPVLAVRDHTARVIVRRETVADMLACDVA